MAKDRKLPFNPLTVPQATALAQRLAPHHARTLWVFSLTATRPKEMFEEHGSHWSVEPGGVRINGTKSPAADRVGPRVGLLVKARDSGASDSERQDGRAL